MNIHTVKFYGRNNQPEYKIIVIRGEIIITLMIEQQKRNYEKWRNVQIPPFHQHKKNNDFDDELVIIRRTSSYIIYIMKWYIIHVPSIEIIPLSYDPSYVILCWFKKCMLSDTQINLSGYTKNNELLKLISHMIYIVEAAMV